MSENEDRQWVQQHVVAFALGELDEVDESRCRELISTDPDFAELVTIEDPDTIGHVPAALIARWEAAGRVLGAVERELLEAHVHACPTCREELALVRQAPPVAQTPGPRRSTVSFGPWVGGIVLGAAAMLAVLLLRPPAAPELQGARINVVTPRAMRGGAPDVLRLAPDARAFLLAVNLPVDVEPGVPATLLVHDSAGRVLVRSELPPAPWSPPSTQVLVVAEPRFEPGEYRVELRLGAAASVRDLGRFVIEGAR